VAIGPGAIKKARSFRLEPLNQTRCLRQLVVRSDQGAQRTSRNSAYAGDIIGAASRTRRNAAGRVQLDVGRQVGIHGDGGTGGLALFQRPLLGSAVNLTQVVMQALACEVARAFTKLGMAMAANRPIMATTIMISTNVKPARVALVFFIFISLFF